MKAKTLFFFLIAIVVLSCSPNKDTKKICDFKASVYCYFFSSYLVASVIADNIEQYEKGFHYFDVDNECLTYSNGVFCENVEIMVTLLRNLYKERKTVYVIDTYKLDAEQKLPENKADLKHLYNVAREMEDLAINTPPSSNFVSKYNYIRDKFASLFSVTDYTYNNTSVDVENLNDEVKRFQEALKD